MLPSKFVGGEPPISQPTPHALFRPGILATKFSGNGSELPWSAHAERLELCDVFGQAGSCEAWGNIGANWSPRQPSRSALTPALSPGERVERSSPDRSEDARLDLETRRPSSPKLTCAPKRHNAVHDHSLHHAAAEVPPLPGGEGWGEGVPGNTSSDLFPSPITNSKFQILNYSSSTGTSKEQFAADSSLNPPSRPALTPALSPGERVERSWPDRSDDARLDLKTRRWALLGATLIAFLISFFASSRTQAAQAELKDLSVNGGIQDGKARLVIEAQLAGLNSDPNIMLFASTLQHVMKIGRERIDHSIHADIDILQGQPRELIFSLGGDGEITKVTGDGLQDWSIRQETNGTRSLVLRPRTPEKGEKAIARLAVEIAARHDLTTGRNPVQPLSVTPIQPALGSGYVKVMFSPELDVQAPSPDGLIPMEIRFLPEALRPPANGAASDPEPLAFRFQGTRYALPLAITLADPEARRVVLRDFQLRGRLAESGATFTLTAIAQVRNPRGGTIALLSGGAALTDLTTAPGSSGRIKLDQGRFLMVFDGPGEFPVRLQFNAAVRPANGWNQLEFRVAPSALQPVTFEGLGADTQFEFAGAARPERRGTEFVSYLPPDGLVKLAWKTARPEAEGKLFYAAEMLSQITVSPGLMRQVAVIDGRVMQGELNRVTVRVRGAGNVTRVQGRDVLSWNLEAGTGPDDRRLIVQFNQPQKDAFALVVQMQTELGTFPQAIDAVRLQPEGTTRWAGHFRVVNEGAVRLEVVQATGLSQISPEQFPETDATKALLGAAGGQRFAFRFSSADFALRVQADNVLPELGVSGLLAYHLGENELSIDAELELDVREAPVRELLLRAPRGFAVARLTAANLADYFTSDGPTATEPDVELRLVFSQPVLGRQVIQLRLERNAALGAATWALPRVEVVRAKTSRGHIAVSADAGFRLSPERTQGLTEIATAFFPRKLTGIQAAFRLSDAAWQASMRVERLPQSIQADVFHLFSIGEGIGYGSSTINYVVSGAPLGTFRVELSEEYFNVEFTGRDVRNWQKTTNGYVVQLHTPVAGPYTLLATYERPFKAQGDTLAFTGARPLDAQSEQGHTIIVSAYQFNVTPANVSPGLLALEPAEVPGEYRLFTDAPILAAYRYSTRPFNLQLQLTPLSQGDTISLVVDRASLNTRISKSGEVVTDARYFIKNRGNTHFRVTLPEGTELWSATVNGNRAVPVKDGAVNLIPLPPRADPNTVQTLDLKLASKSSNPARVIAAAPVAQAPVLLADWKFEPDTGQRLEYRRGSLTPSAGVTDSSGFAGLVRLFQGNARFDTLIQLAAIGLLLLVATTAWRWATGNSAWRFGVRHLGGGLVGLVALGLALAVLSMLLQRARAQDQFPSRGLSFLAPVQQAGSALSVEVSNVRDEQTFWGALMLVWPAFLAVLVWGYAWINYDNGRRSLGLIAGWTLIGWAALRWPNGAPMFIVVVAAFVAVHLVWPALRRLKNAPRRPNTPESPAAAPAATALLMLGACLALGTMTSAAAEGARASNLRRVKEPAVAESVVQTLRVEDKFAFGTARIRWHALKDQLLPVLYEPAVVTGFDYPSNALTLIQATLDGKRVHQLLARQDGTFEIELRYQLALLRRNDAAGVGLPAQHGIINRLTLTLVDQDADVTSPSAVSIEPLASTTPTGIGSRPSGTTSSYQLVLTPTNDAWVQWKPRSRDARREKAQFYAEWLQLFIPTAGVIEGLHQLQIRPAQGELNELTIDVPAGATITDVLEPRQARVEGVIEGKQAAGAAPASFISLWRFDPDTRKLRISLNPPQSRPFTIVVRSQLPTGPLPFEQSVGLLTVTNAAGQLGLIGVATGNEVQLDNVTSGAFAAINLEDFPSATLNPLAAQFPGLAVRRAYRHADATGVLTLKASAVEPDVRVETQETLSLGEDRTVLAANLSVAVTRAGIFRLSFVLPGALAVESISGAALSHWTELAGADGRVVTLHLKGRTEGSQQFAISLTGPGTRATNGYVVPRLAIREAGKQRGQLVIVPEQGLRLQVGTRDGVTQLDPQKAGIRQKGVLAFRLLQSPWNLSLDLEQVDAWVQVTSLQHVTVAEAQLKLAVNLQYQIENTGLKALRVQVPTNAESVRFRGEQVADFLPVPGSITNGLQTWEIKLHRRMLGKYLLQLTAQLPLAPQATTASVAGIQALDVNLQRGFVTVQSDGRLQVRIPILPPALQITEWQAIPRTLQQDMPSTAANHALRLVESTYVLPLALERHEPARLLPARVTAAVLTSVVSDDGVMLTQARLEMIPGDKRLLELTLPADAKFWFAFVNQGGVWPWRRQDTILIPLEQQSRAETPLTVELYYSSRVGQPARGDLNLALHGPKFDLPLENIVWQVYLNEKWELNRWNGTLQLEEQATVVTPGAVDVQAYLQSEATRNRDKTKQAETMLSLGNQLLEKGDPAQARRAFQSAFGLSTHDSAFNEDARVQLHNLKLQQALLGLNVRQSVVGGEAESAAPAGKAGELRNRKDNAYTQQEAKQILESNSAEQNDAFMKVAERLVQQQDAAVAAPVAIRATIPQQGRALTFKRAVQVDRNADLRLTLNVTSARTASRFVRLLILGGAFALLAALAWMSSSLRSRETTNH